MKTIAFQENIPVRETSFDVVVAGGGVAGIAAALTARRAGKRVLLIEKSTMLGGLATLGLINLFVPMCNGRGKQIIFGLAEEFLRFSVKYGWAIIPEEWRNGEPATPTNVRYIARFSPHIFAISILDFLADAGIEILFDTIVSTIPAPDCDGNAPLQILFSTIDYDDYVGRIGVGRIERGTARRNQIVTLCGGQENKTREVKLSRLYRFEGLKRVEIEEASAGELVAGAGVTGLSIGETACDPACIEPLPFVHIDEPTISMMFLVNDSPFAGKEGKYVTSRNLRDRLFKEVETNVS
ncbi:MAG: FAD-dependent oxidoreductase, partial [Clostridiales bacterium]|nr:FAD-dependent oxidoreductase [Clostridiales bacterium]